MHNLFHSLTCILILLGLNPLCSQPLQNVRISGQVSSTGVVLPDTAVEIIILHPLTEEAFNLPLDAQGRFELSFMASLPGECLLVQGEYMAVVPYMPGDTLQLSLSSGMKTEHDWLTSLQVDGNRPSFARSAFAYQAFSGQEPSSVPAFNRKMSQALPPEMLRYADSVRTTHLRLSQQFLADHPTDPAMETWILRRAQLGYIYIMKFYPSRLARRMQGQAMPTLPTRFDTFYQDFLVEAWDQEEWLSREFWAEIENHITPTFVIKPIFTEQNWDEVQFQALDSLFYARWKQLDIPSYLEEFAIAKYTVERLQMDLNPIQRHGEFLENKLQSSPHWPTIQQAYAQTKRLLQPYEDDLVATFQSLSHIGAESILDSMLAQHEGKVVYLDIWATWCGPCRQYMTDSKRIHHELGDAPIAFVYLCMDSNEDEWESLVQKYALGGSHYFLDRATSSAFSQHMHLQGYPTYMIFDKRGQLAQRQAPTPMDRRLKPMLLNLAGK